MATLRQASVLDKTFTKDPEMYDVVMLNDDITTMDFVVLVLKQVFLHSSDVANALMLKIHRAGYCVVGSYTFDIAQSKVSKATRMAREAGFPLRIKVVRHS